MRICSYESEATEIQPHKKSTGQLGHTADQTTTDPSKIADGAQQQAERGARTAENMRYGQTISEGGMGGMTNVTANEANKESFGRQEDKSEEADAAQDRRAEGYGGKRDMNREIGA